MFFTLYNMLFWGGIIFFVIGVLNILNCFGQSLGRIIACLVLMGLGVTGFWFGDEGRRQEKFQFEIAVDAKDTVNGRRELPGGSIQVIFNEDRTSVPSNQLTISKRNIEFFEGLIQEDEDGTYIEVTREDYKRLKAQ